MRLRRAGRRVAYGQPIRWGVPTRQASRAAITPFAMFARYNRAYLQRWLLLGVAIGVGAGVSMLFFFTAIQICTHLFLGAIAGFTPPDPTGEGATDYTLPSRPWLIPVATTLGGLLTGLVVCALAPETAGGGTDPSIETFHEKNGRMRARVPGVKLVASAITIGSGGSAGREGASAQIVAGIGSWLGDLLHLDDHDRRIAVVAGIGAGIGTIFRAPFAGAIFAAEVLYRRDFEADAIFPTFIASAVGYAIYGAFAGWTPVFGMHTEFRFDDPRSLVSFLLLGICCGLLGMLFHWLMTTGRALFQRLPLSPFIKPAIGGLLVGLIGIVLPETLGMGYGFVQFGVNGDYTQLGGLLLAVLVFAKMVTTSLTLGSGGSGGDIAPALVIGGFIGGSLWTGINYFWPAALLDVPPGAFVVVGMAAFFGGVSKTPLAMILLVAEMTGQLTLIVPGVLATMIAYLITGDISIYDKQVETRLDSPAHKHDYVLPLLQTLKVADAMSEGLGGALAYASPSTPLDDIARFFRERDVTAVPVIEHGLLVAVIAASDLARIPPTDISAGIGQAHQVMSRALARAYADETLYAAWLRMSRRGLRQLVVVKRGNPSHVVGMLTADAIGQLLRQPVGTRTAPEVLNSPSATVSATSGAPPAEPAPSTAPTALPAATAVSSPGTQGHPETSASQARKAPQGIISKPIADRQIERLAHVAPDGDPLAEMRVEEAMLERPPLVPESAPLTTVRVMLQRANALLVVDAHWRLVGIITRADLRARADVEAGRPLTASDVAVRNLVTVRPHDSLRTAVRRMGRLGLHQLPVVAQELPAPPVGLLRRSDVLAAYGRMLADEPTSPAVRYP
jgi:CIC family chloride channel protein